MLNGSQGALLPMIAVDLGLDAASSARVSAVATASLCVSKLSMGPVVDCTGGKYSALGSLALVRSRHADHQ